MSCLCTTGMIELIFFCSLMTKITNFFQFIANQALRIHISKNHPEYELPPPGTVMNKNALKKEALNMLLKMTDQPVPAPETS